MGTKLLIIDGQSLLNLLTHYTDGAVDLDAKLLGIGISQYLGQWVGMDIESNQWKDEKLAGQEAYSPLHIRYEGKRILKWGHHGKDLTWGREGKDFETPKQK
jgi:hypothetical protein